MTFTIYCQNCGAEVHVFGTAGKPARTWGPPEHCYEATDDEFEPTECSQCGVQLDQDDLSRHLVEALDDAETERAIERTERLEDYRRHYYD